MPQLLLLRVFGKFQEKVLAKTPGLYQIPKLRNATTATTTRGHWGSQREVLTKTPCPYQVPKLRVPNLNF